MAQPATYIVISTVILNVICLISLGLRFMVRIKYGAGLAHDDYSLLIGSIFITGLGVCTVLEVYLGHIGQHVVTNSEGVPQYGDWLRHFWEIEWLGQLISIALLPPMDRTGHCYSPAPVVEGMATTNLIIDIAILATPQPIVWKLHMPLKQRVAVSFIFLLGFLVVGIGAVRVYYYFAVNQDLERKLYDIQWFHAPAFYWTNFDACDIQSGHYLCFSAYLKPTPCQLVARGLPSKYHEQDPDAILLV
ncbi:hypothetical protein CIB48_g6612 [Xylaria polymorpha]|nr:hypothetical protein CIB48_g6612 [Xylaria polymorpha]